MTPFFILTVGFLFGLGILFASTDRQDVIANWDKRRCAVPVIIGGAWYKPAADPRSSLEFASDNFKFCMEQVVRETFTAALNPILALFKQQIDFAIVVKQIQNGIQEMLGNFFRTFSKLLDGVFQRFIAVGFEFRRIFGEALQAMERAFGIAITTVYLGISTVVGIDNSVKFVMKVVMIILGILAGLMILLFFILLPVLPIIMTTIAVLVAGGVAAGGLAGTFCFAPGTKLATQRGSIRIEKVALGDTLSDGGVIEGILRVNGSHTDLYQMEDTIVSGDHLVYYENLQRWILVKEHPRARPVLKREPVLYCLNTSTRVIPIGTYKFRDWEELTPNLQKDWNLLIGEMLKGKAQETAEDYPLLSGAWFVETPDGRMNLRDVHLGMKILDETGQFTKVLGIYEGTEQASSVDSFWSSDSIWWKEQGVWSQKPVTSKLPYKKYGFHLITDSGTFKIFQPGADFSVRDFTEVGCSKISETYEWMKRRL